MALGLLPLIVLLWLVQPAAAQTRPTPVQTRPASLDGAVVKVPSNEPVVRAAVELRSLDPGDARIYSTTSDPRGSFAFRNIPPGRYQLTALRGGLVRGDFGIQGPGASGVTVVLASGQRLADVRLAMRGTGVIAGRVRDPQGEGIGNVHVKALRYSYRDGRISLVDVKSVLTNDLGEYRLGWLPPGLYNVSAQHPDSRIGPTELSEQINSSTFVGTVVTNPGGFNGGGFAASGNGDPAVRARLGLLDGDEYLPIYYPGTFDLRQAVAIDVRADSELPGHDLVIAPVRTATITGSIQPLPASANGTPARVTAQISRNPNYNARASSLPVDARDGSFAARGLAPGAYIVSASSGSGADRLTARTAVEVVEGGAQTASLLLVRGVDVPVIVSVEGALSGPLPTMQVTLQPDPLTDTVSNVSASIAKGASSMLAAVAPNSYRVNVTPFMPVVRVNSSAPPAVPGPAPAVPAGPRLPNAYIRTIRFGGADALERPLRIEPRTGDTALEIVLATDPAQVEGVVVSAAGRPAGFATVVLTPAPERRHRFDLYQVTTTDAGGRFRLGNITPGDYRVFAWEDVETGAWLNPDFMRAEDVNGQPLQLLPNANLKAELRLIPSR